MNRWKCSHINNQANKSKKHTIMSSSELFIAMNEKNLAGERERVIQEGHDDILYSRDMIPVKVIDPLGVIVYDDINNDRA
jgi:hypothetical protein